MNVIITGASKGLGYAIARQFSKAGSFHLYLISRSGPGLAKLKKECLSINPSVKITLLPFDLRDLEAGDLPAELLVSHVDILINNAGLLVNKSFSELHMEEITGMIGVNYLSPVLLMQKLIDRMGGKHSTHIVNISSMGGFQGSSKFPGLSIYSSTKAALASLTECLAEEYKDKNIFFNCLALGAVQTEMLEMAFPGYKTPMRPETMAAYIVEFALNGYRYYNGKVLPLSLSTP